MDMIRTCKAGKAAAKAATESTAVADSERFPKEWTWGSCGIGTPSLWAAASRRARPSDYRRGCRVLTLRSLICSRSRFVLSFFLICRLGRGHICCRSCCSRLRGCLCHTCLRGFPLGSTSTYILSLQPSIAPDVFVPRSQFRTEHIRNCDQITNSSDETCTRWARRQKAS